MNNNDKDIEFDPDYHRWSEQNMKDSIRFYKKQIKVLTEKVEKYKEVLCQAQVMLSYIQNENKNKKNNDNESQD